MSIGKSQTTIHQLQLDSPVQYIKGVGPKMAAKFEKIGVETVRDLLFYFPRTYKDYTQVTKIGDLQYQVSSIKYQENNEITIRGKILEIQNKKTSRRRFIVTEAVVGDDSGSVKVVWFNQPFLVKTLFVGREVILNGKISFNFYTKEVVLESPDRALKPMIVPVYPETAGLSSHYIWRVIISVKYLVLSIKEWLPHSLIESYKVHKVKSGGEHSVLGFMPIQEAIATIHEPENMEQARQAQRRLAFDELFMVALQANLSKEEKKKEQAPSISIGKAEIEQFTGTLPFELTQDQEKVSEEIIQDLNRSVPMSRLLNGDVGSGKTVVAAIASMVVVMAKYKVVLMAPTEILANQHFDTFNRLFSNHRGMKVGLYTANKKCNLDDCDVLIGTHALIQKGVNIKNIGLVIVDEQHRFGVAQRAALGQLGVGSKEQGGKTPRAPRQAPHFLSMTATPIPRTLHLALFGDLDLSVICEKPANRKEIKTRLVEEFNRPKAYEFIREHLKRGRQAFIICPLIESREQGVGSEENSPGVQFQTLYLIEDERKTVKDEYEKLHQIFPEFNIGMLHGRMKAKEKDEIMTKYSNCVINILVSTSVVEVGVDVPNATIMMIEDAERFGLAQLHQFRGRVGRAEHQSFCFLFSSTMSDKAKNRLKALESTSDGFKLAEIDLEARGPGVIFGTEQSGLLDLKMATFSDRVLLEQAAKAAKEIAPVIDKYPILKVKSAEYLKTKHLE